MTPALPNTAAATCPSARVVAITKPLVDEADTAGDFIAYAARVSNPVNQASKETAPRLLAYLQRNKHWSPFEMASAVVEIVTTRDIARQLLRHRSLSFQEFSQRYAEVETGYRNTTLTNAGLTPRRQDATNRQNSIDDLDAETVDWWRRTVEATQRLTTDIYRQALAKGIAKECARAVLPEGLTVSRLHAHGSFRSWLHYLAVREDPATQAEHRELARAIRAALALHEPALFAEAAG